MPSQQTQQALEPWIDRGEQAVRRGVEVTKSGWARAWPWMRAHPKASLAGGGAVALVGLIVLVGLAAAVSGASRGGGGGYYGGGGYGGGYGGGGGSPADAWVGPNDWQGRWSSGTAAGRNSVISGPDGRVLNLPN